MLTSALQLGPKTCVPRRWVIGLLLCSIAPVWAASSASSASSDAGSASVGSVSTSIEKSSTSSSGGDKKTAAGEYRVVEIAPAPSKPSTATAITGTHPRATLARLKLRATANTRDEFYLYLPQPTLEQAQIQTGQLLRADDRSYGLAFSHAGSPEPFFLVLADDWQPQLKTQVLKL